MKRKCSLDHSTKLSTGSFLCQILRFFNFYFRNWFKTTIWKIMIPINIIDHITTFNSFLFIPYIAILHENLYCFFYFSSAIWKSWKNYLLCQKKSHGHSFVPNGVKLNQNGLLLMQFHLISYESISGKNVSATFFFDGFWISANLEIIVMDRQKRLRPWFLVRILIWVSWIAMQKFVTIYFFIWPKMTKVWNMQLAVCDQTRGARELIFGMDTNMTTINTYTKN